MNIWLLAFIISTLLHVLGLWGIENYKPASKSEKISSSFDITLTKQPLLEIETKLTDAPLSPEQKSESVEIKSAEQKNLDNTPKQLDNTESAITPSSKSDHDKLLSKSSINHDQLPKIAYKQVKLSSLIPNKNLSPIKIKPAKIISQPIIHSNTLPMKKLVSHNSNQSKNNDPVFVYENKNDLLGSNQQNANNFINNAATVDHNTNSGVNSNSGSQFEAKTGISNPVAYRDNPRPLYPTVARRRGLEGTVILTVMVNTMGRPINIEIKKSSGSAILDQSAFEAIKNWRFEPARQLGQPLTATVDIPMRFHLLESE